MQYKCLICGKKFFDAPSSKRKTCSRKCGTERQKTIPHKRSHGESPILRKCLTCGKIFKAGAAIVKRGWGKYCSNKCWWEQMKRGQNFLIGKKGYKAPAWKGKKVGYGGLHTWLRTKFGQPTKCELCGKDGLTSHKIHWANKSGQYLRKRSDWFRLCSSCHQKYDMKNNYNGRLKAKVARGGSAGKENG